MVWIGLRQMANTAKDISDVDVHSANRTKDFADLPGRMPESLPNVLKISLIIWKELIK